MWDSKKAQAGGIRQSEPRYEEGSWRVWVTGKNTTRGTGRHLGREREREKGGPFKGQEGKRWPIGRGEVIV